MKSLEIVEISDQLSHEIWDEIICWGFFEKDTIGKQLARSIDSISANITESQGRFTFPDRKRFIYYARGSLFESRNWIEKAIHRGLITEERGKEYLSTLAILLHKINIFLKKSR